MELLQTFEFEELKVQTYYIGTDKLPNKVYLKGKLVLEDETFKPSPLKCIDDTETMASLLGFYALRSGDVEEEYFEKLNCPQLLAWAEEDELVRMMLFDFEMREDKEYLEVNKMTYEECSRIEDYIVTH